jgi:hypothetical protein
MAYVRGVFAALALVGFLAIVPGIMYLTGEHLNEPAMIAMKGLLISLGTGTLVGLLTYLIPLTPRRERDIRRYCAELLGVSADPARVSSDTSALIADWLKEPLQSEDTTRTQTIRELISTRLKLSQSKDKNIFEKQTDDLIEQLRRIEKGKSKETFNIS